MEQELIQSGWLHYGYGSKRIHNNLNIINVCNQEALSLNNQLVSLVYITNSLPLETMLLLPAGWATTLINFSFCYIAPFSNSLMGKLIQVMLKVGIHKHVTITRMPIWFSMMVMSLQVSMVTTICSLGQVGFNFG